MPIDYLIGTLIAASTVVNALALGAFWITPGLRTTANRFVINLLIVNLVGCVALTPSLFGGWTIARHGETERFTSITTIEESTLDAILNGTVRELIDDLDADIERAVELVSEASIMEAVAILVEGSTKVETHSASTESTVRIDAMHMVGRSSAVFWGNTRYWGFDLTAALGNFNSTTLDMYLYMYIIGCVDHNDHIYT